MYKDCVFLFVGEFGVVARLLNALLTYQHLT